MRVGGPICPHSGVLAHSSAAQGAKHLIRWQNQAKSGETHGHSGNVGLYCERNKLLEGGAAIGVEVSFSEAALQCGFYCAENEAQGILLMNLAAFRC